MQVITSNLIGYVQQSPPSAFPGSQHLCNFIGYLCLQSVRLERTNPRTQQFHNALNLLVGRDEVRMLPFDGTINKKCEYCAHSATDTSMILVSYIGNTVVLTAPPPYVESLHL